MIALSRAVACGLADQLQPVLGLRGVAGGGYNAAPLCHMREGPDGSPSRPRGPKRKFEEGYAWGTGS